MSPSGSGQACFAKATKAKDARTTVARASLRAAKPLVSLCGFPWDQDVCKPTESGSRICMTTGLALVAFSSDGLVGVTPVPLLTRSLHQCWRGEQQLGLEPPFS